MLTWFADWLPVIQWLAYLFLAALVLSMRLGYKGGTLSADVTFRLAAVERRLDTAGGKISELATFVQGLPDRLRVIFLPREVADERFQALRDDLNDLHRRDPLSRTRRTDHR